MTDMRKTILVIFIILCSAGCREYDIGEVLLQREDISLTVKGNEMLAYRPESFQIGYNESICEYRVFDDVLGNWFVLRCQERPSSEGQNVKASLSWTTANDTKSKKGLSFRVEKTDSKGYIWLWCESEAIGIVVKEF